jgi:hypothetical protein
MQEPGLDSRHRDENGRIDAKRGDTKVKTLREIYGEDFLPNFRSDARLDTVREKLGEESLTKLVKESHYRRK